VTIIPRGPSLGSTMWLPEEDKYNTRRKELLDHLVVIMGGRVAEDIAFGDVTSGARGDIKQATGIARKMVCQWGMSEKLGMIEYGEGDEPVFLARDFNRTRDYSESTAQAIDAEVKLLIDEAYGRATTLLTEKRPQLEIIAKALLEWETLEGPQIRDLIAHGEMKNPPHRDPPPPPIPTEVVPAAKPEERKSSEGSLPGDLSPVPA
jgi:cell division protease FtsH